MKIYEVTQEHSEALHHRIAALFMQQISVSDDPSSYDQVLEAVRLSLKNDATSRIIVAEIADDLLGVAFMNFGISLRTGGYYLWLNELYVDNEHRNEGVGKELLLYTIHLAESENIKTIELETGVNNSVTKHMYNSLGFYEVVSKRYGFTF